jgi:hypothetical protein
MAFRKRFPKDVPTSPYPQWVTVKLTQEQEDQLDESVREAHASLMQECLQDAKELCEAQGLKDYQTDTVQIAISLFEKRASHLAYHKEEFAYDQFTQED